MADKLDKGKGKDRPESEDEYDEGYSEAMEVMLASHLPLFITFRAQSLHPLSKTLAYIVVNNCLLKTTERMQQPQQTTIGVCSMQRSLPTSMGLQSIALHKIQLWLSR